MYIAYRWISRDLGKAELVFSIIVISFVFGVSINKTLELFASTERLLVDTSITNMEIALRLQNTIQSIGKNIERVEIKEGMNPIILMNAEPDNYQQYLGSPIAHLKAKQFSISPLKNYLGEMYNPDIEQLERGNWYFDYDGNVLVYLVEHQEFYGDNADRPTELRYKVHIDYTDSDNNQRYEAGKDVLNSISLININKIQ